MKVKIGYIRTKNYMMRHGVKRTIHKFYKHLKNYIFYNRDYIFMLDLRRKSYENIYRNGTYFVDKIVKREEIPETLWHCLTNKQAIFLLEKQIEERFDKGVTLWTLRSENTFVGYTWSMVGGTIKPYYFPFYEEDVHMFDGYIFQPNRGRNFSILMMNLVLQQYKSNGIQRAFVETREWNKAAIKAIRKMEFELIGLARKRYRSKKTYVTWWK